MKNKKQGRASISRLRGRRSRPGALSAPRAIVFFFSVSPLPPLTPSSSSPPFAQVLVADLASPSIDLPRAGPPAPAPERFTRVAWGSIGAEGPHPVRFLF